MNRINRQLKERVASELQATHGLQEPRIDRAVALATHVATTVLERTHQASPAVIGELLTNKRITPDTWVFWQVMGRCYTVSLTFEMGITPHRAMAIRRLVLPLLTGVVMREVKNLREKDQPASPQLA